MLKTSNLKLLIFLVFLSCNKIINIKYTLNNDEDVKIDSDEETDNFIERVESNIKNGEYEILVNDNIISDDDLDNWCVVENKKKDSFPKSNSLNYIVRYVEETPTSYIAYKKNNCIKFHLITEFIKNPKKEKKYHKLLTCDNDYINGYSEILHYINKRNDLYFQFSNPIKKFPEYKGVNFIKKGIYKLRKNEDEEENKGANGVIYILEPYKNSKNCKIINKSEEDFLIIKFLMPTSKVGLLPSNIFEEFKKELKIYDLLYGAKSLRKYAVPTVLACINKVPILIKKYVNGGTLKKLIEEDKADGKKLCNLYKMMVNIKQITEVVIKDLHAQNLMYDKFTRDWKIVDAEIDPEGSKTNSSLLIQLKTSSSKRLNKVVKIFGAYKWAFDKQRHIEMINTVNNEIKNIYTANMVKDKRKINIKSDFLEGLESLYSLYPQEFSLEYLFRNIKEYATNGKDKIEKEELPLLFLILLNKNKKNGRYGDIVSLNFILKYFPKLMTTTTDKKFNLDVIQFSCLFGLYDILKIFFKKYFEDIDFNKKDKYGQTFLHLLANKNKLKIFYKYFEHYKAKLPPYKVISHDYINGYLGIDRLKIADELINKDHIDKDYKDEISGDTALHLCCKSKYLNLYKRCLFSGCNDTILNNFGYKPSKYYQYVIGKKKLHILKPTETIAK